MYIYIYVSPPMFFSLCSSVWLFLPKLKRKSLGNCVIKNDKIISADYCTESAEQRNIGANLKLGSGVMLSLR